MFRKRPNESRMAGPRPANRFRSRLLLALLVIAAPVITARVAGADDANHLYCMMNPCTNVAPWEVYRLKSFYDPTNVAITMVFVRHELYSQIDDGFWYAKGSSGGAETYWDVMNECMTCSVKWKDYAVLYETSLNRWHYVPDELPAIMTP